MVTKRDLLDHMGMRMGLYDFSELAQFKYYSSNQYRKSDQDKDMALEMWCDENFYEFVANSPHTRASEIINDYNRQMWSYLKMSPSKHGKDIFNACLAHVALIQDDLEKTWGDLDWGD